jgi:hypothetical protein
MASVIPMSTSLSSPSRTGAVTMPDNLSAKQSELCIRLYTEFRAALDATPIEGQFMPYDWQNLPNPLDFIWMPYAQMLDEYARELANIINDLTRCVRRLRAWATVISPLSDEERMEAKHEFIGALGTVALGLPYAIKSRFAYAAAHLCHQANRTKDLNSWKDEFPNKRALYLNDIERMCAPWKKFRAFKQRVEAIAGSAFKEGSDDFRHAYNHRFSAHFVLGMTSTVSRNEDESGAISYSFGGSGPLDIAKMADLLKIERDHCYEAFCAFQVLVREHEAAITAFAGA